MKNTLRLLCFAGASFVALTLNSCTSDDDSNGNGPGVEKPDLEFFGLTANNTLVKLNANDSDDPIASMPITGLSGDDIIAIDFRPQTGQLVGLGSSSRLYVINHMTGAATALGAAAFTPAISGDMVGFDFNPTVDRIRLVTSSGQNLRLNPETGVVAATDGNLNPGTPMVGAAAYDNNMAGATATSLFVINYADGMLYKQNPPNDGTLTVIGSLGISGMSSSDGGFDIAQDNATALASFTIGGENHLYKVNLTTGNATDLGSLEMALIGIAIPVSPVGYAVDGSNNLHIFNFMNPGTPVTKAISGLQPAESMLGIDMRPATGQLFGLGSSGRLYSINVSTGAAVAIGAGSFGTLEGTEFGFDFNPVVDRVRIVSNTGQNLRVNPNDGTLSATDGILNPGTPMVTSAAYTNNFAGTTATTLLVIDSSTDMVYTQNPPNNGTLAPVGMLGADITSQNGFDIGGTSNSGYAILTVGSTSKIYGVNTTTGAVTAMGNFPQTVQGFAVGLGF